MSSYLRKQISILTGCSLLAACSLLAMDESKTPSQNYRLGTATHFVQGWDPVTIMPLIRQAGFGWIRDEIVWADIEKEKGKYVIPENLAKWVDLAAKADIKIIAVLNFENKIYPDRYDPAAYAAAAAFIAREFKGKIQVIEILNEPHNFGFSKFYGGTWNGVESDGKVSPWLSKYVKLLNGAAAAIKKANPEMKVIGLGSVAPANFRMLELGISRDVDGIVDHPYSFSTVPELIPYTSQEPVVKRDGIVTADKSGTFASQIRLYREESVKRRGPAQIYLTEFGFTTYREGTEKSMYLGVTEEAQGKYIMRRFAECLGLNIATTIQYDFKNDGVDPEIAEQNFGLVRADLTPKPSYAPVQRLVQATAGFTADESLGVKVFPFRDRQDDMVQVWDGAILATPGGIKSYSFKDAQGQWAVTIWSQERVGRDLQPRVADLEIPLDPKAYTVECTDFYTGEKRTLEFPKTGEVMQLTKTVIPDSPLLLRFLPVQPK